MNEVPGKFTIPHSKVWFRPDQAYFEYQKQAKNIDHDEIEHNGKHKRIRDAILTRDLAKAYYGTTVTEYEIKEAFSLPKRESITGILRTEFDRISDRRNNWREFVV